MEQLNFDDYVFTRGYIIANEVLQDIPQRWKEVPGLPDPWKLYVDPLLHWRQSSGGLANNNSQGKSVQVVSIGFFTSLRYPGLGPEQLNDYLTAALIKSKESFQKLVDSLQGHFVIFAFKNGVLTAQSDAMAIYPLFYAQPHATDSLRFVTSHVRLAAAIKKAPQNEFARPNFYKENGADQNFADTTSYEGIYRVSANLELNVTTGTVSRIFPRRKLRPLKVKQCVKLLENAAKNHLDILFSKESPYSRVLVSITGGIDTRTNLSLIKDYINKVSFFTFDPPSLNQYSEHDFATVREILKATNIKNHVFLPSSSEIVSPGLEAILRQNTEFSYSSEVAQSLLKTYGTTSDTLHLRSSGYEIGRGYYRKLGKTIPYHKVTAQDYMDLMCRYQARSPLVAEAYKSFWNKTNCDSIAQYGYDPLDLLLWEQKMSVWHSMIIQEHAVSFDSSVLINSRMLWDALISVPPRNRREITVFRQLIGRHLPELNLLPVNGKPIDPPINIRIKQNLRQLLGRVRYINHLR
ncbi:MAG: hypothetical protein Q4Q13_00795 [Vagococcus sp.]|nr:hypothetical protein [Vagococcus sp.]